MQVQNNLTSIIAKFNQLKTSVPAGMLKIVTEVMREVAATAEVEHRFKSQSGKLIASITSFAKINADGSVTGTVYLDPRYTQTRQKPYSEYITGGTSGRQSHKTKRRNEFSISRGIKPDPFLERAFEKHIADVVKRFTTKVMTEII